MLEVFSSSFGNILGAPVHPTPHRSIKDAAFAPFRGLRTIGSTSSVLRRDDGGLRAMAFRQAIANALRHDPQGFKKITKALNIMFVSAEVAPSLNAHKL